MDNKVAIVPSDYTHYFNWWSGDYYYKRIDGVWYEWSNSSLKWQLPLVTWYKFYWFFGWRMSVMGKTHKLKSRKTQAPSGAFLLEHENA